MQSSLAPSLQRISRMPAVERLVSSAAFLSRNQVATTESKTLPTNYRWNSTNLWTNQTALGHRDRYFHSSRVVREEETITVNYIMRDGSVNKVQAKIGENLLNTAHENGIEDLEGACECSLACSTCHVYVDDEYFNKLPEPNDDEKDMLDLAFALTPKSRLGCQIIAKKEIDGIIVKLPPAIRNLSIADQQAPTQATQAAAAVLNKK